MLLKSLELQGFKTFPDKTKLTFNEGMTAIVGPNGSGKSNISDAIRWVLGEQAPKSLRCSKMEDVIFDGTDTRKRLGFAEVTLNIDNTDRVLPFDSDNVAVTRRFFRSGESEYLLNKAYVRLKDIHELFMDTGLGRDGYSMIGQGKIDAIVSSKSEDRREIFEEAAGISRYRYRKIEAERKLVQTEENLVRLRDIVTALSDRIGPLETQSKKAKLFIEYSEEKKGLEIALWLETLKNSDDELRNQEDKIYIATSQYNEVEEKLSGFDSENNDIYEARGRIQIETENIRKDNEQLIADISEIRSTINVAKNDIEHNKLNIDRINSEISSNLAATTDIKKDIEEKEAKILNLEEVIKKNQRDYDESAEKLTLINTDSSRSGDKIQELTQNVTSLTKKQADERVSLSSAEATINEMNSRVSSLNGSYTVKSEQLSTSLEMQKNYVKLLEDGNSEIESLTNSIAGLELRLKSRSDKKDKLKQKYESLDLEAQRCEKEAGILINLARNYEGYYKSVRSVMTNANKGFLKGIRGPVSQIISVDDRYALAIEVALGSQMQHIITESDDDAKKAIEFLKKNNSGRATFLPINTIKPRNFDQKGLDKYYGYIGIASSLCSCDDRYKDILSSLLGHIVVVEDLQIASKIAKDYRYRFKIVTVDGQIINVGGSFTGGSKAENTGLLSRESDIKKLTKKAQDLKTESENVKKEFNSALNEFSKTEADILGSRADLSNAQQNLAKITAEYNACVSETESLKKDIENISNEIDECNMRITSSRSIMEHSQSNLEKLNTEIENIETEIKTLSGSQVELSQKREALASELQELKLLIVTFKKDIENLRSDIQMSKLNTDDKIALIEELRNDIEKLKFNNENLNSDIEIYEQKVVDKQSVIDANNERIEALNKEYDNYEIRANEIRNLSKELNENKEKLSNEVSRLEERKNSIEKEKENILTKLWEEYELTERGAHEEAAEISDRQKARTRLAELKSKIKNLGSVNLGAIEEYKEVSEQYDKMSAQVNDIEKAKKDIETLIRDLTKQMQDIFVEAFRDINKNFNQTFRDLFDGGDAKLELTEPEDILNSGIDIIVHPPGKLVLRLEALSGGEKALVAIALYFSIMKVRPAPFCVMDEIEAALDEVNVDRFARYVRTLSDNTQFILITHRRGTMEEADVLYGVTMQDKGVSKLLALHVTEVAQKLNMKVN